jgi:hypothetical protein
MNPTILEEIIGAIADAEGTEPENLDITLQNHVSTDAIQNLVHHRSDSWRLQFETPNHVVEVTGNESILVDGEQQRVLF